MIGKTIGQYQVIDKIGEGGMGAVYKAEDTTLHRLVALKTLSSHLTEDEEAKERFIREAQAASALNHPNITTVYEFIEDDDTRLICMEYVEGKTIRDMVESGVVSVRKAIDIIMQAAEALEAAHNKGILHRDVKSANIMVNMEGRVKVMDFGLAHLESRSQLTRTGTTMGTLSYSSPEQISGKPVDRRSEIFSLGIVFYELLTGQLPFKAANEAEIVFAIINNEPPKLTKVRDDVPELVEAVVSQMLEKDPELRYQTCGDVISDLKGLRKEMETSTVGITGVLERVQTNQRKALIQRLAASVVAVAIVITGIVLLITGGTKLDPNKVVVAPFANETGDPLFDSTCQMIADMISQGLESTGTIDVFPFRSALQIYRSLEGVETTKPSSSDLLKALTQETGAGISISGSMYLLDPETLRFQVDVSNIKSGELIHSLGPLDGSRENPKKVIEQLRDMVVGGLASYFDPLWGESAQKRPPAPSYEAYRNASQGFELFFSLRYDESIPYLEAAGRHDSTYVQPLIFAAMAYILIDKYAPADSIARSINRSRALLYPLDEYGLDWLVAVVEGRREDQYQASSAMAELIPDWSYVAAIDANHVNRPKEAIAYITKIDPESALWENYPNTWNRLTEAYHLLGKHRKELKAVRRQREQHPESRYGILNEAYALAALGKIEEVKRILSTELLLPVESGTWRNTALELREHGHPEAAADILNQLIDWYKARPDEERLNHRDLLAWTLYSAERWEEASSIFTELYEENPSLYVNPLGLLAARRNDREEAIRYSNRLREIHGMNKYDHGALQYNQACIYSQLGDKDEAVRLLQESYRKGRAFSPGLLRDSDLEPLRGYPPFEEFIRPKG